MLDQAAVQIIRERQATPPADSWRLLPELLRNSIACLALAMGFVALAVRSGAEVSVLREWQQSWGRWQGRLKQRRASRRGGNSDADDIRQLIGEERESRELGLTAGQGPTMPGLGQADHLEDRAKAALESHGPVASPLEHRPMPYGGVCKVQ